MLLTACGGPATGGGGPGGACTITVSGDIAVPTTLTNDANGCDYLFEERVTVSAKLTIEPGTEVRFARDSTLSIEDGGSLSAIGTADSRILLRGAENTRGYWYGLCFSENEASRLEHVDLLNAGKVWLGATSQCRAAISHSVGPHGPLSIVDTVVAGSLTSGLDATELTLDEFARNTFAANEEYGVRVSAANLSRLDKASDYAGDSLDAPNGFPYVLAEGYLEDGADHTWPRLNVPYLIGADDYTAVKTVGVAYGTHVEIEPGTSFLFGEDGGISFSTGATFVAQGTAAAPIVFAGLEAVPGAWHGLSFHNAGVILDHVEVSWGGDGLRPANVTFTGANTLPSAIKNALIRGSLQCGVWVDDDSADVLLLDGATIDYQDNQTDVCLPL